jgi:plasmid stability protein
MLPDVVGSFTGVKNMATLHVRSVPEDLYDRVRQLAQLRSRSLGAQVVTMLYEALDEEEQRKDQMPALTSIRRRRFTPPKKATSSLDLLREDRKR